MIRNLQLIIFLFCFQSLLNAGEIKAIIFDMDGTLIDNGNGYFLDWQYALRQQGYELSSEGFWNFMNEKELVGYPGGDAIIVEHFCALLGRDCSEQLIQDKKAFSKTLHGSGVFLPIAHTVAFLHRLGQEKQLHYIKIGLASGSSRAQILKTLKSLGVEHYFDVIVSGHDDLSDYQDPEGTNKPKPYIYLFAAEQLGLSPNSCVAIEDSRTGIISAVRAGCYAVAVPNIYTSQYNFSEAHLRIDSFEAMTPADFMAMFLDKSVVP